MESLVYENRRLTVLNNSLSVQIEDLKSKLKNEVSKNTIFSYNITNISQARSSIFRYKKKIKSVLLAFNLFKLGLINVIK